MTRATVCVIGGGISGLVAAHSISTAEPSVGVVLLEGSDRLGGAIRTETFAGLTVEAGADSFLTRAPDAVDLCTAVGLGDELVAPAIFGASIWSSGRLVELPPDLVVGMPASAGSALRAGHLTPAARLRAAIEPLLPGPLIERDVSVGSTVRRRFGAGVLERSVDPLLAGTRAGDPAHMSLESALAQVWGLVRGKRSISRAFAAARARNLIPVGPPPFKSVTGGLGRLTEAVRAHSERVEFRTNARVHEVTLDANGAKVRTDGGSIACDAVIAAVPSFEAARLFRQLNPRIANLLQSIEYASVATIVLRYPPTARTIDLPGSGMLVPSKEGKTLSACTWYSVKWPHSTPPDGGLLLRAFVGRSSDAPALGLSDDALVERATLELSEALGLSAAPDSARVARWPRSLPQYTVGHAQRVDLIEAALNETPQLWVTGASYRGAGIPDCIRHAQATAARVLKQLHVSGVVG